MTRTFGRVACLFALALATSAGFAQVVKNGCPGTAPDHMFPYLGGPGNCKLEAVGILFEELQTVEFFTTGGQLGVCLLGDGDPDGTADEWWVATNPAAPVRSGFSLACVLGQCWDELIVEDANGDFTNINCITPTDPLGSTPVNTPGGIVCAEIQGGRGGALKCLVWEDSGGGHERCGGITSPLGAGCPGAGTGLSTLPAAPVLARGPAGFGSDVFLAAFFPPAFADRVIQNVEKTAQVGSVPLMSDWMLGIFVMLVLLVASWMITRRGRRRAMTEEA